MDISLPSIVIVHTCVHAGQYRLIVARLNDTSFVLQSPFDDHAVVGESLVAIVATVGGKVSIMRGIVYILILA